MKTHEKIHTGEKPYECDICDMAFVQLVQLKLHERTHTGERPFKCRICGKSYTNSFGMTKHVKKIHPAEKPYKCTICDKTFDQSSTLKAHERIHTDKKPYKQKNNISKNEHGSPSL